VVTETLRGWRSLPLEECMDAIIDYRGKTPRKATNGVPLVTAKVVKNGRIETPNEFIAQRDFQEWMRRGLPQPGDVVITTEAPLGEVAQLGEGRVALAQRLVCLRGKLGLLDNRFLKFLLMSSGVQQQLRARSSGTTVLGIRQAELRRVVLTLPPVEKQREVANILGALDDKIDLNRQMNQTLEAMAQAFLNSAFFGRGWHEVPLSDVAELNPTRRIDGDDAPYVEMANLPTVGHRPSAWPVRAVGSGARFQNGDTLFARITPCLENGKTAYVDFLNDGQIAWGSTEYIVIRPKPPLCTEWGYLLARSQAFRDFAVQKMEGTTGRQRVPAAALAAFRVPLPPPQACARFAAAVSPLFRRMAAASDETRTLASLRDVLLPRLLSGELVGVSRSSADHPTGP